MSADALTQTRDFFYFFLDFNVYIVVEHAILFSLSQVGDMTWWHHQMAIFSALLAVCEGNPPFHGGFPSQRPVTRSFYIFFDLRLNKRLSKHRDVGDLRSHRAHYDAILMRYYSVLS